MFDKPMTIAEVKKLPASMTPKEFGAAFGYSERFAQRACKEGRLPARLVFGGWRINTKAALAQFGIVADEGEA